MPLLIDGALVDAANGETFNPDAISAAHKTLPLPSYVEVTALDTGRTILVRVNDRGPMANDRLIDLSQATARKIRQDLFLAFAAVVIDELPDHRTW